MTWVCSVHLCEPIENQELGHCSIWTTMACTSRPNMWWRLPAEGMFCGCLRYWRKAIGFLLSLFCSRFTECEAWLMPSSQTLQQKPPEKPGHSNVPALQAFKNGQVPRPRLADARWSEWFRTFGSYNLISYVSKMHCKAKAFTYLSSSEQKSRQRQVRRKTPTKDEGPE